MVKAYVGLGSNLGDRRAAIESAVRRLAATPCTRVLRRSAVRETDPVGKTDQPRFLNAVVEIETSLPARRLLERLKAIESEMGRERGERWGPRVIDLDLLLYGRRTARAPGLVVPHPRLAERAFVLEPLAELCPEAVVPGTRSTVSRLVDRLTERAPR
jgi:2-amino-4-hydroxy-6-hydroxymethyldihydropteridine diphosphokinase